MSEKRYFKIFSEHHTIKGKNNYVELFNAIDVLDEEDDAKIKKHLAKKGINDKFLSSDKNYLYQQLLKSLNDYHNVKTINLQLKEQLLSIEILFQKGLYAECLKMIAKSEELANECENYALMIDLLMWKKKCMGYSSGLEAASAINNTIERYLKLLTQLKQITNLYYKSYSVLIEADGKFTLQHREQMKAIQQHSLFKDEVEPFTGKVYHLLIKSNYHLAHNQPEKEMKVMEELIAMIDRSTTYGMENPLDYVSIYNRMIGIYKQANSALMFSSIKALTGFGERAHIRKELIQERIYIHCITHELEYYLLNSDYKKIISRLKVIEEELPKLSFEIEKYHLIYYHYLRATAYIFSGHYHKALKGINFALNEFKADNRPSVYVRLLMLNAVVHFELGNYELIERIVKVLYKENSKYPTLTDIELKVCRAIQDVSQSGEVTKSQMIATFNPIHELLQRINKKSGNNTLMRNVEYWVKMRL